MAGLAYRDVASRHSRELDTHPKVRVKPADHDADPAGHSLAGPEPVRSALSRAKTPQWQIRVIPLPRAFTKHLE